MEPEEPFSDRVIGTLSVLELMKKVVAWLSEEIDAQEGETGSAAVGMYIDVGHPETTSGERLPQFQDRLASAGGVFQERWAQSTRRDSAPGESETLGRDDGLPGCVRSRIQGFFQETGTPPLNSRQSLLAQDYLSCRLRQP